MSQLIPPPADPPPDPAVITYLIGETPRQAANFPTVLVRDDWLLGVVAVQQVQMFLGEMPNTGSGLCPDQRIRAIGTASPCGHRRQCLVLLVRLLVEGRRVQRLTAVPCLA